MPCAAAPTWLFDLDNTLHNADVHIFPHINRSMTDYVMQALSLDETTANQVRERYWRHYGATLLGLMRHHGTDPHHFLHHTHRFPDLGAMLVFNPAVVGLLRRLPGKKIVFSNGPRRYAESVLRTLGIRHYFHGVFAIEHARFTPKPQLAGFLRLLRHYQLRPGQCIMVEDTADNLRPAKHLGMTTVLLSRRSQRPAWVDYRLNSVLDLAKLPRHRSPCGPSMR